MRLYAGDTKQFLDDAVHNRIADHLKTAFFAAYGYNPSPAEYASWRNSLRAMGRVVDQSRLYDNGILVEYQLPLSSQRLDCMITGCGGDGRSRAIIVELKQWEGSRASDSDREVLTWVGGAEREVLHPSVQAGQYAEYLRDGQTAFHEGAAPVDLGACAYLHNYTLADGDPLVDGKFGGFIEASPLFAAQDADRLCGFLAGCIGRGGGMAVMDRIEKGGFRASKKLMEHVAAVITNKDEYTLLDEQLVSFDRIMAAARAGVRHGKRSTILVRGGPGTGKSVIAVNVMAGLLREGINAHYATGSRAFTQTLRESMGARSVPQIKYFNSYVDAKTGSVDVILCDEAHRIRENSFNRFTPRMRRTDRRQIDELLNAAKVAVFFIDDDQVVRPGEIGSASFIREAAATHGHSLHEYELEIQFRCSGSDAFLKWIENTLHIRRTAHAIWTGNDNFDFQIFATPQKLEGAIRAKAEEGFSARMTAGFCWDWSTGTNADGTLRNDVVIGDYHRPWNARPETEKLAKTIPPATLWAYDPRGLEQVGCIYTAQGFEFDYVGVIFGPDLTFNMDKQTWEGQLEHSGDTVVRRSRNFAALVKNTYRVLLSRGLKGCYVHFMDKDTERFFRTRMEHRHGA